VARWDKLVKTTCNEDQMGMNQVQVIKRAMRIFTEPRLVQWLLISVFLCSKVDASQLFVVSAENDSGIPNATVTLDNTLLYADENGALEIDSDWTQLMARAPGFSREIVTRPSSPADTIKIALMPIDAKGLYLSVHGIGSQKLRTAVLETLNRNNMNALVIDIKGDRGHIPFKANLPKAQDIGAQDLITVRDMPALLDELRNQGIYLIARIVVFKDNLLASAHPEWQVLTEEGHTYIDNENLRWIDPFKTEAWNHTLSVVELAAEVGFDEVQLDYVRFPATTRAVYSQPSNEDSRTQIITRFLEAARDRLIPHNVFLSADVFGYALWNSSDTHVGQKIKPILDVVDIMSPMLYPSGFHLGIPGYVNPVDHVYEIIYKSLKHGVERTGVSPRRFRPWLQAFKDYAFDRKNFGPERMRDQIRASEDFGASGWMFWNPRNVYPLDFNSK